MKKILALMAAIVCTALTIVHATTTIITVDLTENSIVASSIPAIRETATIIVTNAPGYTPGNLTMSLIYTNTQYAVADNFVAGAGSSYSATMNLNTILLTNYFVGLSDQSIRTFTATLWDSGTPALIFNDKLEIQNNPYVPGMLPAVITTNEFDARLIVLEDQTSAWNNVTNIVNGGTVGSTGEIAQVGGTWTFMFPTITPSLSFTNWLGVTAGDILTMAGGNRSGSNTFATGLAAVDTNNWNGGLTDISLLQGLTGQVYYADGRTALSDTMNTGNNWISGDGSDTGIKIEAGGGVELSSNLTVTGASDFKLISTFESWLSGSGLAEGIMIGAAGHVGINTPTLTSALNVLGSVFINGALTNRGAIFVDLQSSTGSYPVVFQDNSGEQWEIEQNGAGLIFTETGVGEHFRIANGGTATFQGVITGNDVQENGTNILAFVAAATNSFVLTNDVRTVALSGLVTVPDGTNDNAAVNLGQVNDLVSSLQTLELYGATNLNNFVVDSGSLYVNIPTPAWSMASGALSDGDNWQGYYWGTQAVDLIREGSYSGFFFSEKTAGIKDVRPKLEVVYTNLTGGALQTIGCSSTGAYITATLSDKSIICNVTTNTLAQSTNLVLGVRYGLFQSGGGSAAQVTTYGGTGYGTHMATPGLGSAVGYVTEASADGKYYGRKDEAWTDLDARYVNTNNAIAKTLQVDGHSTLAGVGMTSLTNTGPSYLTGNVGIGTATTRSKMDVAGSATVDGAFSNLTGNAYFANQLHIGIVGTKPFQIHAAAASDIMRIQNNSGMFNFGITSGGGNATTSFDLQGDNDSLRVRRGSSVPFQIQTNGAVNFAPVAAAPATPVAGDMYIDSTLTNMLRVYNGSAWKNAWE